MVVQVSFIEGINRAVRSKQIWLRSLERNSLELIELSSRNKVSLAQCSNTGSISNTYNMRSGRSVSVDTDTSALHEKLCALIQNGHSYCKLLIKRPQIVMFSNYV